MAQQMEFHLQQITSNITNIDDTSSLSHGPHGYRTFPHSRCQAVPTAAAEGVALADIAGDWSLVEYHTSFGGKPFPPHSPYLCQESRIVITPQGNKHFLCDCDLKYQWKTRQKSSSKKDQIDNEDCQHQHVIVMFH